MPVLTKNKTVKVRAGMICDCCGKEDQGNVNDFAVQHTFGYDSPSDMTTVSFALCDKCLLAIALEKIPGAQFSEWEEGNKTVSREEMTQRLTGRLDC